MSLFKCHPIGQGKHQNVHFIAQDSNKMITFRMVIFLETGHAYIVQHKIKLDYAFFDHNLIYNELKNAMKQWDYKLMTPLDEMYTNHDNTEAVLKHFNMYEAYVNII